MVARKQKGEVEKLILAVILSGAIAVAAATLPGLALAIKPFLVKKRQKISRASLEAALKRFRERRLVEFVSRGGRVFLQITERGKKRLRALELDDLRLDVPKNWDKKWSAVLFDIPETKKTARDALRHKLRQLGCFQFHKSVFVHPAPCEDEIDFLAELFNIQEYVTVFRTPSLGKQEYRAYRFFGLLP